MDIITDITHRQSQINRLEDPVAEKLAVGSNEPQSLTHVPPVCFVHKPNGIYVL